MPCALPSSRRLARVRRTHNVAGRPRSPAGKRPVAGGRVTELFRPQPSSSAPPLGAGNPRSEVERSPEKTTKELVGKHRNDTGRRSTVRGKLAALFLSTNSGLKTPHSPLSVHRSPHPQSPSSRLAGTLAGSLAGLDRRGGGRSPRSRARSRGGGAVPDRVACILRGEEAASLFFSARRRAHTAVPTGPEQVSCSCRFTSFVPPRARHRSRIARPTPPPLSAQGEESGLLGLHRGPSTVQPGPRSSGSDIYPQRSTLTYISHRGRCEQTAGFRKRCLRLRFSCGGNIIFVA